MRSLLGGLVGVLLIAMIGAIGPGGCTKQPEAPQNPNLKIPDVPPSERDSRKPPEKK
jgi:hypothetical protein